MVCRGKMHNQGAGQKNNNKKRMHWGGNSRTNQAAKEKRKFFQQPREPVCPQISREPREASGIPSGTSRDLWPLPFFLLTQTGCNESDLDSFSDRPLVKQKLIFLFYLRPRSPIGFLGGFPVRRCRKGRWTFRSGVSMTGSGDTFRCRARQAPPPMLPALTLPFSHGATRWSQRCIGAAPQRERREIGCRRKPTSFGSPRLEIAIWITGDETADIGCGIGTLEAF